MSGFGKLYIDSNGNFTDFKGEIVYVSVTPKIVDTTPYDVSDIDTTIAGNTNSGDLTFNLPPGKSIHDFRFINTGTSGNVINIVPNGSDLLFGVNETATIEDKTVLRIQFTKTEGYW